MQAASWVRFSRLHSSRACRRSPVQRRPNAPKSRAGRLVDFRVSFFCNFENFLAIQSFSTYTEPYASVFDADKAAEEIVKFTSAEHKLKEYLLKDYDADIFPTRYSNETLKVKFGLAAIRLIDVHEQDQYIAIRGWLRYYWADARLRWDPAEFDGINVIRIRNELVWKPDITLFNGVDEEVNAASHARAVVSSDGHVLWIPPRVLKASCSFDMSDFPNDAHNCTLKFGSWTFDGFKLDLDFYNEVKEVDMYDFIPHHEYYVVGTTARRHEKYYPCCAEPYPDLTFYIHLRREPGYFVHFYVSPAVVMSLLMPFVFLVKPGSGRSSVISVGVLVCASLLITQVMDPVLANRVPAIMLYYNAIFTLMSVCLVLTVLIDLLWAKSGSNNLPAPLTGIISCLGRIACVKPENFTESNDEGNEKIDVRADRQAQWKALAIALSRLLFVASLGINIIITLALLA